MPQVGAFGAWRQITGISGAGIAKPHGNKCDQAGVVKQRPFNSNPSSQSIAAGVIPGNARLVNPPTRGLPNDQNSCCGGRLQNRTGAER